MLIRPQPLEGDAVKGSGFIGPIILIGHDKSALRGVCLLGSDWSGRHSKLDFEPLKKVLLLGLQFSQFTNERTPQLYFRLRGDSALHSVKTGSKDNVSLNEIGCLDHLLIQYGVSNNARCVTHITARLIQAHDAPHDPTLLHISQLGYVGEGDSRRPRVHYLD